MLRKHGQQRSKRFAIFTLIACLVLSAVSGLKVDADSWPDMGEAKIKSAQPHFSGYRVRDIEVWSEQTDPHAELMQAKVPLQERNKSFPATQANPKLTAPTQVMLMQGDYGNSFFDSTIANNAYGNVAFNFWQYTDYFCPWHGAATIGTPRGLYDPATSDWQARGFEFGIVNIPNQAYINAAHKNGVKAIACIYFDPHFRPGQTKQEMFVKDADDKYIVAEQLIKLAQYYGFDGYFLNDEEWGGDEFKPLMAQITAAGLWTQFYDTNSSFNANKSQYLKDDVHGKIHDSVFVNYGWRGVDKFVEHAAEVGVDPYEAVFLGIEANHGKFGNHSQTAIANSYDDDKNPKCSVALFTPSDMYQRGVDELTGALGLDKQFPVHQRKEYQWMIAERERMYFSGVKCNPKDTGKKPGYSRPDVVVSDASGWVGVADFKSEASVISGSRFYSTFNIGKGVQYFAEGEVANDEVWTNLNDQDILPSWQWWFETAGSKKLQADFDFGDQDIHNDTTGQKINLPYQQVGAWHGGSSLVVYGDLEKEKSNFLHLYKTDLSVDASSKAKIRYRKSSSDQAQMKLGLIFKDEPQTVKELTIEHSAGKGDWVEDTVDLAEYTGKEIAALGFVFAADTDVKNYQMNIGQIQISNSEEKPAEPKNFRVSRIFEDGQAIFRWTKDDYQTVDKYRVYAVNGQGEEHFLGGIYDDVVYVKNHFSAGDDDIIFKLVAVGKDGQESDAAEIEYEMSKMPKNIEVKETEIPKLQMWQAAEEGKLEISWQEREEAEGYEIAVETLWLDSADKDYRKITKRVSRGTTEITIETGLKDGYEYELTVSPVAAGKILDGISYRGRLYDGYAAPMTADDVTILPKNKVSLKSPLTRDWRYVTLEFQASGSSEKKELSSKQRGVSGNYHSTYDLGASKGTIFVTLEDYCQNKSTLEIEYKSDPLIPLREALKKVIAPDGLIEETYVPYKEALEAAEALLTVPDVTDAQVEKVIGDLKEAERNLVKVGWQELYNKLKNPKPKDGYSLKSYQRYLDEIEYLWRLIRGADTDTSNLQAYLKRLANAEAQLQPAGTEIEVMVSVVPDQGHWQNYTFDKMVDGDRSTYGWIAAGPKAGQQIIFELSSAVELTEAILVYPNGVGADYIHQGVLEIKGDGDWEKVADLSGADLVNSMPIANKKAKFVRIRFTEEQGNWVKIAEMEFKYKTSNPQVDKTELEEAIKAAKEAKKTDKYKYASDDKKQAFDQALAKAEEIIASASPDEATMKAAAETLKAATAALDGIPQPDKTALEKAIAKAKEVKETDKYKNADADKKETFDKVLARAEDTLKSTAATEFEVAIVTQALEMATEALNGTTPQQPDKSELEKAITEAKAAKETDKYKNADADKKEAFDKALMKAEEVMADANADETAIKAAADALKAAAEDLNGTTPQPQQPDKTELEKAIAEAKAAKETDKYKNADADKKETFDKALTKAEEVMADANANEAAVTEATTGLKAAAEDLNGTTPQPQPDKSELEKAIADAKAAKETDKYKNADTDKKEAFDKALTEAETVMADAGADEAAIKAAADALKAAAAALNGTTPPAPNPNPNPQPNPDPEPEYELPLAPYVPEPAPEPIPAPAPAQPEVAIEEEQVALSSAEEALAKELTKDMSKEEDKKLVEKLLAKQIKYPEFVQKLSDTAMTELAAGIGNHFKDETSSSWYAKELSVVRFLNLMIGYEDGTFRAANPVTGKEYVTALIRAGQWELEKSEDTNWFAPYRKTAEKIGLLNGVSFDLTKKANREEMAVLSYNLIVSVLGKEPTGMDELKFSDKEKIAENYRKAVAYLTQKEVLKGYEDGSFDPDKPVVRGDVAAIIYRLLAVLGK